MSLYEPQVRDLITRTMAAFSPRLASPAAVELLLMTGAHESLFGTYLYQRGGLALGFFQIEPGTHNSIFANYFSRRWPMFRQKEHDALATDLKYQIIVARGIYADKTEPLPDPVDVRGMAAYYKKHWNTALGSAKINDVIRHYNQYVLGKG